MLFYVLCLFTWTVARLTVTRNNYSAKTELAWHGSDTITIIIAAAMASMAIDNNVFSVLNAMDGYTAMANVHTAKKNVCRAKISI